MTASRNCAIFALLLLACTLPALAEHGEVKLDGTVAWVDPGARQFALDAGARYVVLWQSSTDIKEEGPRRVRDGRLDVGDRVKVRGVRLDDGRILATRLDIKHRNGNGSDDDGDGTENRATLFPRSGERVYTRRPAIGAQFQEPVRLEHLVVDGVNVTSASSWDGRRVSWTPGYDLDVGRHRVDLQVADTARGRRIQLDWTFVVDPSAGGYTGGGLVVTNLSNGQRVPGNFNVQGQTTAYARVLVEARVGQALIPGVIVLPGSTIRAERTADAYGRFDVPVSLGSVASGSTLDLRVTAWDRSGRLNGETTLRLVRS